MKVKPITIKAKKWLLIKGSTRYELYVLAEKINETIAAVNDHEKRIREIERKLGVEISPAPAADNS